MGASIHDLGSGNEILENESSNTSFPGSSNAGKFEKKNGEQLE